MKNKARYIGCCVHLPANFIHSLVDNSRDISYRTLTRHVGRDQLQEAFPNYAWDKGDRDLKLADDWAVRFQKARVKDKTYYFVVHSGIEYIWIV